MIRSHFMARESRIVVDDWIKWAQWVWTCHLRLLWLCGAKRVKTEEDPSAISRSSQDSLTLNRFW